MLPTFPRMIRPGFSSSHIMRVIPHEPLLAGDTSNTLAIDFSAGAGWLIALQTSIQNEESEFDVLYRSKIAMRLVFGKYDYTESGRGVDFVLLSDFQGDWCHWHPLCRRMEPTDNLYVTFRHVGTGEEAVLPSLSLQYLRDADFTGIDLTDLEELLGLSGHG